MSVKGVRKKKEESGLKIRLADKVKNMLLRRLYSQNRSDIILPNIYYKSSRFECDVFKMGPSGYTTEYEIKISKADFKADFEKKEKVWIGGDEMYKDVFKHDLIQSGQRTNYFFFVIPKEFLEDESLIFTHIPPEYGIITFRENCDWLTIEREAKAIHKNKITPEEKERLFNTLWSKHYFLYWKFERAKGFDIARLQNSLDRLEEALSTCKIERNNLKSVVEMLEWACKEKIENFIIDEELTTIYSKYKIGEERLSKLHKEAI